MITSRRSLLMGLGAALITAPAIVRASSIMPIKHVELSRPWKQNDVIRFVADLENSEKWFRFDNGIWTRLPSIGIQGNPTPWITAVKQ